MKTQSRISNSLLAIACSMSLAAISGCLAKSPSLPQLGPQAYATGELSLAIKWPIKTQVLPETTNTLVIWVKEGSTIIDTKIIHRDGNLSGSANFSLKAANNLTVLVKAYRETNATGEGGTAIAQGQTTINIQPSQTTNAQVMMGLDFNAIIYNVTTYVGDGSGDGQGINSIINTPYWLAYDSQGNTFVTETSNNRIRKIDSSGNVTTFVGGSAGTADGQGTAAQFNQPKGVAFDSQGNLVVADNGNSRIRIITPTGNVTTYVASGSNLLENPTGLAISGDTIFVTDSNRILKITSPTDVTTLAGDNNEFSSVDGTGTAAKFASARDIVVDSEQNLYVADSSSVRKITTTGVVTTIAGGSGTGYQNGIGSNALFYDLHGIAQMGNGDLFVADSNVIRKLHPNGSTWEVTTYTGDPTEGYADGVPSAAKFDSIEGLATDNIGNLYVADRANNRIRRVGFNHETSTLAGNGGLTYNDGPRNAAVICFPSGCTIDPQGNVFLTEPDTHRIRKIDPNGNVTTFAGSSSAGNQNGVGTTASFAKPSSIVADSQGNLFVADSDNYRIRKITPTGIVTTFAGSTSGNTDGQGEAAKFEKPMAISIDPNNNLYVSDNSVRIRKISPSGTVSTPTLGASFTGIYGVAADSDGNIYIADNGTHGVYRIDSQGTRALIAGNPETGNLDGQGSAAKFSANGQFPGIGEISLDSLGNIFVSDTNNSTIRRISPSGNVTTIAGSGNYAEIDGIGTLAGFMNPLGICQGKDGSLYVADNWNSRIRKLTPN